MKYYANLSSTKLKKGPFNPIVDEFKNTNILLATNNFIV